MHLLTSDSGLVIGCLFGEQNLIPKGIKLPNSQKQIINPNCIVSHRDCIVINGCATNPPNQSCITNHAIANNPQLQHHDHYA